MSDETQEVNKGGRPPVVFDSKQTAQVEALAAFLTVEQIAEHFGISDDTFRAIQDRQPEVFTAYKAGKAKAIKNVAQSLVSKALKGNVQAQIFYLKTQAGWKETKKEEYTEGKPFTGFVFE